MVRATKKIFRALKERGEGREIARSEEGELRRGKWLGEETLGTGKKGEKGKESCREV